MKLIPSKMLKEVCKIGQGAECCRFIVVSDEGLMCAKNKTVSHDVLNNLVNEGIMTAQGDNCEGLQ